MSNFSEAYKKLQNPMPALPLYGLGEIVSYGGFRYEIVGFEPNEKEECWIYDLKRVDGTDKGVEGINELGLAKSFKVVEKPGNATHSPKWDRCVAQVKEHGGADPYAVCTAMLGDETFKSMDEMSFDEKMKTYLQKLGIAGAGSIPNSLLAEQDLEGSTQKSRVKKSSDIQSFSVWYYDSSGARKCMVFNNIKEAEAFGRLVESIGFKNISIRKTNEEQDLDDYANGNLIENIKEAQIKRQKATINVRAKTDKSFQDFWKRKNKTNQ